MRKFQEGGKSGEMRQIKCQLRSKEQCSMHYFLILKRWGGKRYGHVEIQPKS